MIFTVCCIELSVDTKALLQNLLSFLCLCKALQIMSVGIGDAQYVLEHIPNVASEVNVTEGHESVMFVMCTDYNHAERAKKHNTLL